MKAMSTKYSITLSWNNEKSKLYIPVLPEKIEISTGMKNDMVNVAELGEIVEKGTSKANEYSWSSILPVNKSPVVSITTLKTPQSYVEQILKLMKNQTVVHLVVSGMGVTDYCLIKSFKYDEQGGDVGTINYSIELVQYQTVTVRKITKTTAKKSTAKTTSRTSTSSNSKTYTVKTGDCLWSIAQAKLCDGNKWTKIYDLNSSTIVSTAKKRGVTASKNNPIIFSGTVLKLPS